MPDHVHLILVPRDEDGLRAALSEAHRRYSRRINVAHGWTGYLWQGRFASFPMDPAHTMLAIRYVELNPVRAKRVRRAEKWRWSSARAHMTGRTGSRIWRRCSVHRNWRAMLRRGLEAGDLTLDQVRVQEAHERTGRPLGSADFIDRLEALTGRTLRKQKPGPKSGQDKRDN